MSRPYWHEKNEKYLPAEEEDRPPMPKEEPHLIPEMKLYLNSRKLSYVVARDNGWYPSSQVDGYDRIIIPCSNSVGRPYWQARAIDDWVNIRYQSPRATRLDSIVMVWPKLNVKAKGAVVCEGPADSLAAAMCGYLGIGIMGNEPPDYVLGFIVSKVKGAYEPVCVVPDLDHIEMGAWMTGSLSAHGIKVEMRIPPKKDLAGLNVWQREKLLA